MNTFWEERFNEEGRIWGNTPSRTVAYATGLFKKAGVHEVLVPGSGYGRNAVALTQAGFRVAGIEISTTAVTLALHPRVYGTTTDQCWTCRSTIQCMMASTVSMSFIFSGKMNGLHSLHGAGSN